MDFKRMRLFPVVRDYKSDKCTPKVQLKWLPPTGNKKDKAFFNTIGEGGCFSAKQNKMVITKEGEERIKKTSFEQVLLQTGFNLVALKLSVYEAMKRSRLNPCRVSPSTVVEFYKSFSCEDSACSVGPIPVDVEKTPFQNVDNVVRVLKYCKESEQFLADLSGLPLLVTQDNCLRAFSVSNPKFLSRHHSILPHCKELFVHSHVLNKVFASAKSLNASVFKRFDVESFAVNLHSTLPRGYFNVDGYVTWCTGQKTEPNTDWIQQVWRFLNEEKEEAIKSAYKTAASDEENTRSIQASYKINTRGNPATQLSEEEKAEIIRKLLAPLMNWAILPCEKAIRDGKATGVEVKNFLVPLGLGESVLDFTDHDAISFPLVVALRKLSLAELKCSVLSPDSLVLARRLVASLKSPASILTCFRHMLKTNPCELEEKLKDTECLRVLTFFSESVHHLKGKDRNTLRQLPFYETTHGGLVNLHGKTVYVVPSEIPSEEMEVLERHFNLVFLLSRKRLSPLFVFLDLEFISPIDLYCKFILNHFWLFSNEARRVQLKHIRDNILDSESSPAAEEKRILKCLTDTEIIPSKDGTLKKASCYYDHKNEVFSTMLTEEMFPPQPFKDEKWMSFLKTVGLIHEVSIDLFKEFATKVSREGATQSSASTESKSRVLVQHLFSRDKVLEEQLLPVVREISFVASYPVGQQLRAIHRQFGEEDGQTPYIAFQGSVLQKDAEITWTTAPILPEWADPGLSQYHCRILDELSVRTKPTVESVTFHCENVVSQMLLEDESEISPELLSTRRTVMAKIYRFLQNEAISGTFVKDRLKDTPCILVEQGSRLVNVQQVVIELYEDLQIKPYIYKMPAEHGEFKQFFQYLGCSLSVQLSHYARILDMLHEKCKENSLDENDEDISLKAVKGIFETLQDNSDGNHSISSLYLPAICLCASIEDETARPLVLRKADELLFDDAPHYHDRLQNFEQLFVVDLGRSHVRCNSSANYKELVLLLPATLQPQMLSTAVEETFAESIDNTTFLDTGFTRSIKRMLHSEEFYRGIVRLIRHASHENHKKLDEHLVASLKTTLKSIELNGMKKIVTHLLYNGRVIPGSEREVSYFVGKVNQSGQENWNVYISAIEDETENMPAIDLTLSQVIKEECKGMLQDTVVYIPPMLHSQPGKIGSLLDRMKIRQDDSGNTGSGNIFPEPGCFIPIADRHLLNPAFEPLKPSEYVGYEVEDPCLDLQDGDATYIYAIIVEEVATNATNLFSKSYKIDIGHEKVAWATDLYKLCRFQDMSSTAAESLKFQISKEKQEIFDEISRTIEELWRLPKDRRLKVTKRLYLQWYLNRNPENETLCSQVCQHIINEVKRLEGGASYDIFFDYLEKRARQDNSSRQEYMQTYFQHYGPQIWEFPPSFCQRNPQPREAQRWFRQAEDDLAAFRNDTETHTPSHVWACFKCHQAAEKALKAAQYAVDASRMRIHDLRANAARLDDSQLKTLSSQLEELLGDSTRMRYPDQLCFPEIPKDVYTHEDSLRAIELATQIIEQVRRKFL